jgi:cytochrome c oxidase subunit 4
VAGVLPDALRRPAVRRYVLTFVALLVLTGLTFGLSFADLGPWGVPVALTIATAKAVLIALFFMHLVEERTPAHVAGLVAVLLGVLLIVLASMDVSTRSVIDSTESGLPGPLPRSAER